MKRLLGHVAEHNAVHPEARTGTTKPVGLSHIHDELIIFYYVLSLRLHTDTCADGSIFIYSNHNVLHFEFSDQPVLMGSRASELL